MRITRTDKAYRGASGGPAFEDSTVPVRHMLSPCQSTSFCNQSAHERERGSIPCSFQPWKITCALSDAVSPEFSTSGDREQRSCPKNILHVLCGKVARLDLLFAWRTGAMHDHRTSCIRDASARDAIHADPKEFWQIETRRWRDCEPIHGVESATAWLVQPAAASGF